LDVIASYRNMKTHAANGNGTCGPQSRTALCTAIHWLENYVSENPYNDAAIEAQNIIRELEAVRMRPAVDELLALIVQIPKAIGVCRK
jgi:hypothetical protein